MVSWESFKLLAQAEDKHAGLGQSPDATSTARRTSRGLSGNDGGKVHSDSVRDTGGQFHSSLQGLGKDPPEIFFSSI